ncbi:serine/threonine protein kinase [Burkholderia multivorans]|nr:serine/threonine protein kinase [Burkholderia multivorans]MCO1362187.1 serine/threonine protein kinase [Burkholderia multivorans]MCO1421958.1 serine/threonine protein kinase [Burkholderia multivorans]UQO94479.1 serine/threonine protein kinase [Burkholderia multivorans]
MARPLHRPHSCGRCDATVRRASVARHPHVRLRAARLSARARFHSRRRTAAYETAVALALEGVEAAFERAGEIRMLRTHGDCHPSNVLWTDAGPHFVDFDDSRMAPAVQDLWLLLPGDRAGASRALADLLAGYEDFCEFEPRELHLVEALRTLRLIHYAAWLARRWDDPAFPAAFPWFNTHRYWEARVLELREQIGAMQEGPLWPV